MTVRRVEVSDATESLATYIRNAAAGPVVVTDEGRPVAALVMLEDTDLETVALSTDPEFLEIIQSSRTRQAHEGGLSSAEMRRRLEGELAPPPRRSKQLE
jgi:prevent-host-death family protein